MFEEKLGLLHLRLTVIRTCFAVTLIRFMSPSISAESSEKEKRIQKMFPVNSVPAKNQSLPWLSWSLVALSIRA